MSIQKTYEYEERAFLTESSFLNVKAKLDTTALQITPDNKTSYFFVLQDSNLSIASSPTKTVVKYKGGQLGKGNGFEEHEFSINPDSLDNAIDLFTSLFNLKPQLSEQFRLNYILPNSIEVSLKYTQTWGFHLEIEKLYTQEKQKPHAKQAVDDTGVTLGIDYITDDEMDIFKQECAIGTNRGQYTPDEFRLKYEKLFTI